MKYNPARGGHAPGHLREAFGACFEDPHAEHWYDALTEEDILIFRDSKMQRKWEAMTAVQRARWLIGQLWNCTDIMPSLLCTGFELIGMELPQGSTYAAAARKLRADLD